MTVLTPEWAHELKYGPQRRLRIVKKAIGIKPNQGYRIRYIGTYLLTDDKVYYAYEIHHVNDKDYVTGLKRYAFLDIDTEAYRAPINDEILMMMNKELPPVFYD